MAKFVARKLETVKARKVKGMPSAHLFSIVGLDGVWRKATGKGMETCRLQCLLPGEPPGYLERAFDIEAELGLASLRGDRDLLRALRAQLAVETGRANPAIESLEEHMRAVRAGETVTCDACNCILHCDDADLCGHWAGCPLVAESAKEKGIANLG